MKNKIFKASKEYECNACCYLFNTDLRCFRFTKQESIDIAKAYKNKGMIKKGDRYIRSTVHKTCSLVTIDLICKKYDLYF